MREPGLKRELRNGENQTCMSLCPSSRIPFVTLVEESNNNNSIVIGYTEHFTTDLIKVLTERTTKFT
jgi:hypothetical protein